MEKLTKIPVNLTDAGDDLVLHAAMPGAEPENILVTFTDKAIVLDSTARGTVGRDKQVLRQEWGIGKYHRVLRLPFTVDTARTNVTYDNGVLTVSMPKGLEMTPREIRVKKVKGQHGQTRGHSGRG
jgi:HSP20 family protein